MRKEVDWVEVTKAAIAFLVTTVALLGPVGAVWASFFKWGLSSDQIGIWVVLCLAASFPAMGAGLLMSRVAAIIFVNTWGKEW